MSELKLCKDCKHFQPDVYFMGISIKACCTHTNPGTLGEPEPVYGNRYSTDPTCPAGKRTEGSCGIAAIFWEPRPPEPAPSKPKPWWRFW